MKEKTASWWLGQRVSLEKLIFYLIIVFLPTQLGLHFWPAFSYVYGIRIDYLSPTLYVTDLLIFALFLTFIFKKKKIKINKSIYLFLAYVLLNVFLFSNLLSGMYGFLKICEFTFLSLYLVTIKIERKFFLKTLFIPLVFESVLAIWQFINKGSINSIFYFFGERFYTGQTPGIANASIGGELVLRPYGTFSHPNVLAGFLLLTFSLIIFSFKKFNLFYLFCLLVSAVAIFLTLSRVAIILLVAVVIFKLFLIFNKKFSFSFFILTIIFLLFAIFAYFPVSQRFLYLSLVDSSLAQRTQLLVASFQMFLKSPIFGLGLNDFLIELPRYISQQRYFFLQPVHNIYFLILSQLGVIGLSFFVLLIVNIYRKIKSSKNYLLLLVFLEILIFGFFDHYFLTLQQGQILLALVIGLSLSDLRFEIK